MPQAPAYETGFSVVSSIGEIPADEERSFELVAADLVAASAAAGVERPGEPAAGLEWLGSLVNGDAPGVPIYVPLPYSLRPSDIDDLDVFRQVLGWSLVDVDTFVEWSNPRLGSFSVVAGQFDEHTLSSALVPVGDGIVSHFEGEDGDQNILEGDAVSPFGMPVRLAYADGRIAMGRSTPKTRAWLDGVGPTLAEDPHVRSIAETLDGAGVISAAIAAGYLGFSSGPPLIRTPFDTVGLGWSVQDGVSTITMVWTPSESADAQQLADEVAGALRDGVSHLANRSIADILDVVDVVADDGIVIATVRPRTSTDVRMPYYMLQGDTLFVYG